MEEVDNLFTMPMATLLSYCTRQRHHRSRSDNASDVLTGKSKKIATTYSTYISKPFSRCSKQDPVTGCITSYHGDALNISMKGAYGLTHPAR